MTFTVFGASGYIGSALVQHLRTKHHLVFPVMRDGTGLPSTGSLGHVVYAIGLTGEFRCKPFETVEAHVSKLSKVLQLVRFDSFLYLSSTRLYEGIPGDVLVNESSGIVLPPQHLDTYNTSKLLGEALCAATGPHCRVARLSNVYGHGISKSTFLGSVLAQLGNSEEVTIRESADSAKDYVSIENVCTLLEAVALHGRDTVYNIASGQRVCHQQIVDAMPPQFQGRVRFAPNAATRLFPSIDISRVSEQFGVQGSSLLDDLPSLLSGAMQHSTTSRT
jgi:nucleoside-diphosphate-sugar epimerase